MTRISTLGLFLFLFISVTAQSQTSRVNATTGMREELRYFFGGYGALAINQHSAQFGALPGIPACCPEYNDATSVGPSIGALIEFPLSNTLRLQGRLGYTSMSGLLLAPEVIGNEPVLVDGPLPVAMRQNIVTEHTLDASLPMVALETTVGLQTLDFLWFHIGARAGYLLSAKASQRETLTAPEGYTFLDGSTVRNAYDGAIPEANSMQLHIVFGLGYEITTKSGLSIVPEARYFLPVTAISSVDWRVQSFHIGIGVRYGMYTPVDPTVQRDTLYVRDTTTVDRPGIAANRVVLLSTSSDETSERVGDIEYRTTTIKESYQLETPRPFNPVLSLQAFARNEQGQMAPLEVLRIRELDVIESYPILPQLFFAEGSANLKQTSQNILDPTAAQTYTSSKLVRDQLDVYRNTLNIVAERMRANSRAKLEITGCVNNAGVEQNNRELSRQRAEAVRDYLVNVMGVEASRISTTARILPSNPSNPKEVDGRIENQRVELSSNELSILEPVEFRDRDLVVTPENIVLRPTVQNGDEVASWSTTVRQNGKPLTTADGNGLPGDATWSPASTASRPAPTGAITATTRVQNSLGQSKEATINVPYDYASLQRIKAQQEEGKMIERYSLIVFEYNSAQLNSTNQRIMDKVKQRIQPDSKVRIVGYADRAGNPDYNRELARRRCVEAQHVLGLPNDRVTIEPVGSDRLVFDNDTPEGRSYSRTVQIEIETPLR